jgi:hypothetical protein
MNIDGKGQVAVRVSRDRRPVDTAISAGQHACALFGWDRPHALLWDHRFGETNEAAILSIVRVDISGLAGVHYGRDHLAGFVGDREQHRRTNRVEVPHVMRNVLEVANVFAGIQVERDKRVGIEVVASADRAVEVGRWVADDEIDPIRRQMDRGILPDGTTEWFIRIAYLG